MTDPDIEVISLPMADGGDGFAKVMQHYLNTDLIISKTMDPLSRSIESFYQWQASHKRAIIETAAASGLVLLSEQERNPLLTSSKGTGLMIAEAIDKGAKEIVLGLGGTATNDGGIGILDALGFQFLDKDNQPLYPCGESLLKIVKIIPPTYLPDIQFTLASDVINPLYGKNGAAFVYAPQKGANDEMVELLDQGLRNLDRILIAQTGRHTAELPGSGAAGGIAAALSAYFSINIIKGIELVIDASRLKAYLKHVDLIITGEGKLDAQSSEGKVVGSIACIAQSHNKPCYAICGTIDNEFDNSSILGITKAFGIGNTNTSSEEKMQNAFQLLQQKAGEIVKGSGIAR